jgi:hypothetical protein
LLASHPFKWIIDKFTTMPDWEDRDTMKLTLSILTLVLLIIIPAYVNAAPAYVQGNYTEDVGTSASVSFNNNVTSGNLLVVVIRNGVTVSSTCTSGGRTFALDRHHSVLGWSLDVHSLPNAAGGATSVNCTINQSTDQLRMTVLEFSGVATSSPTHKVTSDDGSGIANAGSVTTTVNNCLLLVAAASDGDAYHTIPNPGSGYTLIDIWAVAPGTVSDPDKTAEEWRVATTAGTYGGPFSSVSSDYAAVLVAYLPADGVPPPPPPLKVPNPPGNIQVN